ncbi:MAG: hypothetical protein US83_C0007G0056 [Candidatus Falkowbacteria bacterium GW2011_GWC2_38_22]|uniref:Uncharacterized protein n=1 Tax=Candidatus Falkowbacteria bacterium GW2011_GWE1_38_31 TaxID=1618638 RepID=A0A0G0MY79_9BACT|nr:MAG: hypothetical protein US73_C0008G0001 [Candidatus Falkowbacteria bacterium GW2011_GWF2_38_1205]KKQ61320.1 MAG: hypothetical protein US83_C0007G0056 [Candidatus Falkowbacteria bacterium GW2011_GWC2_38_22]KKQ63108.1 MAG: hypothetical protein US84_C0008G0001 [Candidatus Falkowbacteria bacterium GW2011_GWF1_38_22]KKQ65305.1 MAG: hypothetical protein US87_C0008G0001 [Candidatus Falkowbacteria bacterium GW2011_GWE2_38_254]KKQ69881.1 MAG: hypothetical protein US91_C0008G0001 [Candidatus Falkowb
MSFLVVAYHIRQNRGDLAAERRGRKRFCLTSGIKEVFGTQWRKFGKIASRAIFLLSLVVRCKPKAVIKNSR